MFRRVLCAVALYSSAMSAFSAEVRMAGNAEAAAAVWSTFQSWLLAYEQADLEGTLKIFDPQVIFSFQGSKDLSFEELRASYAADLKAKSPGTKWVPLVEEVYADGNLAIVRAVWELHKSGNQGEDNVTERNRSMDVFHSTEGKWRIIRSINYPEKFK